MLFVDGENLAMRYQQMLDDGRKPRGGVAHVKDTYVWHSRMTSTSYNGLPNLARVYYYTSVTGDDDRVEMVRSQLSAITFSSPINGGTHQAQLVPAVFKKLRKSAKTRNVDIQIVIDVLRYCYSGAVDRIYLASGDGDYMPLIQEVMKKGTQLELLAFSSGLNVRLRTAVDRLHLLDDLFFQGT